MRAADIGFERFEEDFYADPNTSFIKPKNYEVGTNNIICNRSEGLEALVPYINKPVYVCGFCWNKRFDGWVIIYENYCESSIFNTHHLVFDYRGHTYPVFGFLPSRFTSTLNSTYNNAFYKE